MTFDDETEWCSEAELRDVALSAATLACISAAIVFAVLAAVWWWL